MNNNKKGSSPLVIIVVIIAIISLIGTLTGPDTDFTDDKNVYSENVFSLISSSENEVFDNEIKEFAKKEGIDIDIKYDDTLKITKRLNSGEEYDAVWLSNSIWTYAVDSSVVQITDTKSTSINPVVFGIKKSKAEELGFVGKEVYTEDIVNAVQNGNLKFNMSNPVTTNSGASAYLGILTTLAGNPEVLTSEMLDNEDLKSKMKTFFTGVERSSGDEDYLEEMFVSGDYDAVFSYESSIININKKLEEKNKEILYAIYPVDGVSISDSPIGFIDHKSDLKKEQYKKLTEYLLGNDGQQLLAKYGRRTWYGGITTNANKKVFNPNWGIDTTNYISPLKYPSTAVIKKALGLYQSSLRKPVHVVFCLDYSGSMAGDGFNQLKDAMDYILTDRSMEDMLQFTNEDYVEIIPFSTQPIDKWTGTNEQEFLALNDKVKRETPSGSTAIYPTVELALKEVSKVDRSAYNTSVILMTDGAGNVGTYEELERYYKGEKLDIPVYSIQFAAARRDQLDEIAHLTNGKVFDGTTSLIDAFMEVRGYN